MNKDIQDYNNSLQNSDKEICNLLANEISSVLTEAESKIWHAHPVWFLEGNPIVGYSKQKTGNRLMFWSGRDFKEDKLLPGTGRFKDASAWYTKAEQINKDDLHQWLKKGREIQWDYKNIVKHRGVIKRLK